MDHHTVLVYEELPSGEFFRDGRLLCSLLAGEEPHPEDYEEVSTDPPFPDRCVKRPERRRRERTEERVTEDVRVEEMVPVRPPKGKTPLTTTA